MTNHQPPTDDDPAAAMSNDWDAVQVLQARATAAAARRDASIADLRGVMNDEEMLAQFGIDLTRLEG